MSGNKDDKKSVTARVKTRAYDLLTYGQLYLDRFVSPSTREDAFSSITTFASKRPLISLLIATNLLFALLPTVFFAGFLLTTVAIAFFSALAFTLFWTGIALLFFVPTLFLTAGLAVFVWLWVVGTYIVGRIIYNRLPFGLRISDDKRVIFHHATPGDSNDGFEAIKAEATEARE
ncbi:hypothetical protein GGS21DRAFT_34522 [Xylaria nigripes]|nr:hypothetical protein GGS21DRAFT_34522 [Xylaria nigripes]